MMSSTAWESSLRRTRYAVSAAATARTSRPYVIDEIDGPVLLVGHSYGGSVITADNVVGLVYISGFAPDEGENLTDLQSKFPAPGIIPYIVEHQLPTGGNEFTLALGAFTSHSAPTPAWRSRPSWAVLGAADRCIDPGVHRFSYQRMGATATEIEGASHVAMISPPQGSSGRGHDRSPRLRRAADLI